MADRRALGIALPSAERIRRFRQRSTEALLLAGLTGIATGAAVAAFDRLVADEAAAALGEFPTWVIVVAPAVGLLVAWALLRWLGGNASPATADEYIRTFHQPDRHLDLRPAPARVAASAATLGTGGALGYEGASLYIGASIGTWLQRRFRRLFSAEDMKLLMVVGAAAGVAAIFRAPATGALFALEVPYQRDQARRATLPALIGAVTSYVTFALIQGTDPLIPVRGRPSFAPPDLIGAVVVGVLCGVGARGFSLLVRWSKSLPERIPHWASLASSGLILGIVALLSIRLFGSPVALGPGFGAILAAEDPTIDIALVAALLALRTISTSATLAGGGVGGVFIPLVALGAITGRFVALLLGVNQLTLLPLVGAAAFLGAGYRVPIAAVVFVAEATGRPGFIVPGMIATVVAQLFMGSASVTPYQVPMRGGHMERRLRLRVTEAMRDRWTSVAIDDPLDKRVDGAFVRARSTSLPVLDEDGDYVGMLRVADLAAVRAGEREGHRVGDLVIDSPAASRSWTLGDAVSTMDADGLDCLPVTDGDQIVALVTLDDVLRLSEVLERTDG